VHRANPLDDAVAGEAIADEIGAQQLAGRRMEEQIAGLVELRSRALVDDESDRRIGRSGNITRVTG
jgi:hypothetical protein